MKENKPGYKTTEFWVAIITSGLTWIGDFAGALPPEKAVYVTGGIAAFYAIARGIAKAGT